MAEPTPVFVLCRDRLSPLRAQLAWLARVPDVRVILVDNASTYPPLLEFYEQAPVEVLRLPDNAGQKVVWEAGLLDRLGVKGRYVVTDPDVVPVEECPTDAIAWFGELLDAHPERVKAGFGLKIDDLPECYPHRAQAIAWESQFWQRPLHPRVFDADVDTTFALYQPWVREQRLAPALRTGMPYVARHTPWYLDFANPTEEERYYVAHARRDVTNWNTVEFGAQMARVLGWTAPAGAAVPPRAHLVADLQAVRGLVGRGELGAGLEKVEALVERWPGDALLVGLREDLRRRVGA